MTTFPIIEIGSLPKLPGRQRRLNNRSPNQLELEQLNEATELVEDNPEIKQHIDDFLDATTREEVVEANVRFNIAVLEHLGLDWVYDGEAQRIEMYQAAVEQVSGMRKLGRQVSFYNEDGLPNVFTPFSYSESLRLEEPLHYGEIADILSAANVVVKLPITGAYTLATWSDLGEMPAKYMKQGLSHSEARRKSMGKLAEEFAVNVVNPSLQMLAQAQVSGKKLGRIQIDEPNASAFIGQEELLYQATRLSVEGITGVELGMHICFSHDYSTVAGIASIPQLRFLTLEIANRDDPFHTAYSEVLNAFEKAGYEGTYCVGVIDVHTNEIETPELIAERLIHSANLVGVERIEAAPDCGLRSRQLPVAIKKLQTLVKGAELAREAYE